MGKVQSKVHKRSHAKRSVQGMERLAERRRQRASQLRCEHRYVAISDEVRTIYNCQKCGIQKMAMLSPVARASRSMEREHLDLLQRSTSKGGRWQRIRNNRSKGLAASRAIKAISPKRGIHWDLREV